MPAKRRLKELFDQIREREEANISDCLRMFSLARELVESRDAFQEYPAVRFFGDWSLHSKLDRRAARELLEKIGEVINEHKDGNPTQIILGISELLSVANLRKELSQLFQISELSEFMLVEPEPWTRCATWLLQDLLEKPVVGSEFTTEENETGWGTTPRVLRLVVDPADENRIGWEVETGPRVKIRGRLIKT